MAEIKPPNETTPGDRRNNGSLPLSGGAGSVNPPNTGPGGDRRGGSYPLSGTAGAVQPPNHRFDVGMAKMPQPASAEMPLRGSVPVGAGVPGIPASQLRAKQ